MTRRGRIRLGSVSHALRRGEMLLDSAYLSTTDPIELRMKKVAVGLAYFRVVREWFKQTYGWDWTITEPNKRNAKGEEMSKEELIRAFGYVPHKDWAYNPVRAMKVRVTQSEEKMLD